MSAPIISVVMSVYNGEQYLEEAIQSILDQTFCDFEFIIINDGSTDSSLPIIRRFAENDSRVKLITRENKGLIYSLNEGFKLSQGKYIIRMDADDISLPMRFSDQINFMEQNPEIVASGSWIERFGENYSRNTWRLPVSFNSIKAYMFFGSPIAHPAAIIRRETLKQFDIGYRDSYKDAEDYDLWVQLSRVGQLANIPKVLLKMRQRPDSVTRSAEKDLFGERKNVITRIYKDYIGCDVTAQCLDVLYYTSDKNIIKKCKNRVGSYNVLICYSKLLAFSYRKGVLVKFIPIYLKRIVAFMFYK